MDMSEMPHMAAGPDEILYQDEHRGVAQQVAAALPSLRQRGQEITGHPGPPSVRVTISTDPPSLSFVATVVQGGPHRALLVRPWFETLALMVLVASAASLILWRPPFLAVGLVVAICLALVLRGLRRFAACVWSGLMRAYWERRRGAVFVGSRRALIAVHWPVPDLPREEVALSHGLAEDVALRHWLATAYGACLIYAGKIGKGAYWFAAGFAEWFAEECTGRAHWRPESLHQAVVPESLDVEHVIRHPENEFYLPVLVRCYWDVRGIADQGKLLEALTASRDELEKLRVSARQQLLQSRDGTDTATSPPQP